MLKILFLILWRLGVFSLYFIFDIPTFFMEGERHRRERLLQKQSSFLEALARAKVSAYDPQEALYDDLAYKEIRELEEELEKKVQSFRDKHKFRDV